MTRAHNAIEIESNAGLYLSEYVPVNASQTVVALRESFQLLPCEVRQRLNRHWRQLRADWRQHAAELDIHLPIIGVFEDHPVSVATEFGRIVGSFLAARGSSKVSEGGEALVTRFASSYFTLPELANLPQQHIQAAVGQRLAHYDLCVLDSADFMRFIGQPDDRADQVASSWGLLWQTSLTGGNKKPLEND